MLRDRPELLFITSDYRSIPIGWNVTVGELAKSLLGSGVFVGLAAMIAEPLGITNEEYGLQLRAAFEECGREKAFANIHWAYGQKSML